MGAAMPADPGSFVKWIRVCAWCGVLLPEHEGSPRERDSSAVVTHGICPTCLDAWLRDFEPSLASRLTKDRHVA